MTQYPKELYYELEIPWPNRALLDSFMAALKRKGDRCLACVDYLVVFGDERVK